MKDQIGSKELQMYPVQEEPIVLSKHLIDTLLKETNFSDLIALYTFYYYTAKWQHTNRPYATVAYVSDGMHWTETKVRKAKNTLKELKLIEDISIRDEVTNKITAHYVKVNFIWTVAKTTLLEKAQGGNEYTVADQHPNALSTNKENALSANTSSAVEEVVGDKITKTMFNDFWKIYPRKARKGKALTAWNHLCSKQVKERPSWKELRKAIHDQKESEQWQKDEKYIAHAATWLNQSLWLDDPKEMVSFDRDEDTKHKCPFGWKFGKDFEDGKGGCIECEDKYSKIHSACVACYRNSKSK
jgi:hypothetical protein